MNSLIAFLARLRYSSLFYLAIAALLALGALSLLAGDYTVTPPSTLWRAERPATVINRNGVWVRDPTAKYGYAQVH